MSIASSTQPQAPPPAAASTAKPNGSKLVVETNAEPKTLTDANHSLAKQTDQLLMSIAGFPTLPISSIVPSKTNPRKNFAGAKFDELVASIVEHGVVQPILVRPLRGVEVEYKDGTVVDIPPAPRSKQSKYVNDPKAIRVAIDDDFYEIVCGERRYRASLQAQQTEIPAVVKELSDEQVLEIQIVENLQRDDVTPLEEGEGYKQLFNFLQKERPKAHKQDLIAEIAKKIGKEGKSVRYVYGRMKLTELIPELKKMLAEGVLPASHADELVRLSPEIQQELVDHEEGLFEENWSGRDEVDDEPGRPGKILISFRALKDLIASDYTRNLSAAPWKWDDADLVKKAGACKDCTKNSANEPGGDPKSAMCRDKTCFSEKRAAFVKIQLAQATQEARENAGFVSGHKADMKAATNKKAWQQGEAVKISPESSYGTDIEQSERKGVYFEDTFVIAKAGDCEHLRPAVVVEGPETGHARTVCVERSCKKHFRGHEYGYSRPVSQRAPKTLAEKKKDRAKKFKEETETEIGFETLRAISAAAPAQLDLEGLRIVAWRMYDRLWNDRKKELLKYFHLEPKKVKHAYHTGYDCDAPVRSYLDGFQQPAQINGFLLTLALYTDCVRKSAGYIDDKPAPKVLAGILQRCKVDADAIEKRIRAAKQAELERLNAADDERERKKKEQEAKEAAAKKARLNALPPLRDGELQTSARKPKANKPGMVTVKATADGQLVKTKTVARKLKLSLSAKKGNSFSGKVKPKASAQAKGKKGGKR